MKIYIENYDIQKLLPLVDQFEKYVVNKNNAIQVYSEDGIFEIDENKIYKIDILKDKTTSVVHENKWDLLIDESETAKIIANWLPLDHHIIKTQVKRYRVVKTKGCDMELVFIFNEMGIPIDFYIETQNMDNFFAEHINVFLSMLN